MEKLNSFKDLKVWQKSADLSVLIYSTTEDFPQSELYGITNQIRRAVISISSNIAEGFKRRHNKEKTQFYSIAYGSVAELESQVEIAFRLKFLDEQKYANIVSLIGEVSKMIGGLIKSLNSKFHILNSSLGFTLAELLVAIGLFSVIVSIAVGGFINALRTQRQIAALLAVESNTSLILEQMAREIRTGYLFCHDLNNNFTCASNSELNFFNSNSENVIYRLNNGAITRQIVGSPAQTLTGLNVSVKYLKFVLLGNLEGDGWLPRITISLGLSAKTIGVAGVVVNIETTVSSRQFDT